MSWYCPCGVLNRDDAPTCPRCQRPHEVIPPLEPRPPRPPTERPKTGAWYEDDWRKAHIATYKSAEKASDEANVAAAYGWAIQGVSATEGHVNVGRTVSGAVLTGGLSLLLGGSRTKGGVTVTYGRVKG